MTAFRSISFLVLSASVLGGPASAAPDDMLPMVRFVAYEDAMNRGQVDLALEQFTDDATVVAGAMCPADKPCAGKAAIRAGLMERFIGLHIGVRMLEVHSDGQRLRTRMEVTHDGIRRLGIARIVVTDTIEFQNGKISSLVAKADTTDAETARFVQLSAQPEPSRP
jgi:hypothetical protein